MRPCRRIIPGRRSPAVSHGDAVCVDPGIQVFDSVPNGAAESARGWALALRARLSQVRPTNAAVAGAIGLAETVRGGPNRTTWTRRLRAERHINERRVKRGVLSVAALWGVSRCMPATMRLSRGRPIVHKPLGFMPGRRPRGDATWRCRGNNERRPVAHRQTLAPCQSAS